ncbi:glycoside hydrolase family protein [Sphingomonas bisphenolicum]
MANKTAARGGTLAAIVGFVTAALLLTHIPEDESGRKVDVKIAQDGTAIVHHVSGRQYLRAYLDIVGVATACDGLTSYQGRKIRISDQFTEAQCALMLEEELVVHAKGVMQCTPGLALAYVGRDRARFAAVSLAYNVGVANYCSSTARRLFNASQIGPACNAILAWNKITVKGKKVVSNGLAARRARERAMCVKDA